MRPMMMLIVFAMLVAVAGIANGADIVVDDTTGDWQDYDSIADAVNAASDGDDIYVYAGYYSENVTVKKDVSIIGNGTSVTQVSGTGPTFYVRANGTSLSGMKITSSTWGQPAIHLNYAWDIVVEDINITSAHQGVDIDYGGNITIKGISINRTAARGFEIWYAEGVTIEDAYLWWTSGWGYYILYTDSIDIIDPFCRLSSAYSIYMGTCDWVNITSPTFQNSGVYVRGINDMTITDATFSLTDTYSANALDIGGNRILVDNVQITDYYNAINVVGADNITVQNSVITGTSSNSLDVYDGNGYMVKNVTIDGGFTGIDFDHSDYPRIMDCTITNSTHGLRVASCYRPRIWNNTIRDCEYNFGYDGIYDDHFRPYLPGNNSVDGRTIKYYYGIDNQTFVGKDDDIGYLIVAFCDNLTFQQLDLNHNNEGIWMYKSKNIFFEDYDIVHVFYKGVRSFYCERLYFDNGFISESSDMGFHFSNTDDIGITSLTANGTYELFMTSAVDRLTVNWVNITNTTRMHWSVDEGRLENVTWYNQSFLYSAYTSGCIFNNIDLEYGMFRVHQTWNNSFYNVTVQSIPTTYTGFWAESGSYDNLFENFDVGNGDYYGMRLDGNCNWNTLRNVTVHDVKYALQFNNAGKNTLIDVNLTGDYAVCFDPDPYTPLDRPWMQYVTNSTANGLPILWIVDEDGTEYYEDYGFIGVARSNDVTVSGSILTPNRYGFVMWKGTNSTFETINATDQELAGFYLIHSSNNTFGPLRSYPGRTQDRALFARLCDNMTIHDAEIMWFDQQGILLESCDNTTIMNSTFQDDYDGHSATSVAIKVDRGNWNTVENCNISHWDVGVHLFGAYSWEDPSFRNRVSNCSFYDILSTSDATAIYQERGTNYEIIGNVINVSCVGIYLYQVEDVNVSRNWIKSVKSWTTYTYDYGLRVSTSSSGIVYDNAFQNTKNVLDDSGLVWNVSKQALDWPNSTNVVGGPSIGGNYYSDYDGRDVDYDGIGEWEYNVTGSAGSVDHLPLSNDVYPWIRSCDENGTLKDEFYTGEHVWIKGRAAHNYSWVVFSMPYYHRDWPTEYSAIWIAEVVRGDFHEESETKITSGKSDILLTLYGEPRPHQPDAQDNGSEVGKDYGVLFIDRTNTTTGSGVVESYPSNGSMMPMTATNATDYPDTPNGTFVHGTFEIAIDLRRLTWNDTGTQVVLKLPDTAPTGYTLWKYGPTPTNSSDHWYEYPLGDNDGDRYVTFDLTDGALGDDDLTDDNNITAVFGLVLSNLTHLDDMMISGNYTFGDGTYYLNDTFEDGIFHVTGSDFIIDCSNTTFIGDGTGTCFYFDNCTNVTLIGARIEDYDIGLEIINSDITCPDLAVYPVSWGAVLDPSTAVFINCTFDEGFSVDAGSKVIVMNYLHVHVKDAGGDDVEGADLRVTDNNESVYATEYYGGRDGNVLTTGDNDNQTGPDGHVWFIPVTYCVYDGSDSPTYNDTHVYVRWRLWTDDTDVNMSTSKLVTFQADTYIPEYPMMTALLMLTVVAFAPMLLRRRRRKD